MAMHISPVPCTSHPFRSVQLQNAPHCRTGKPALCHKAGAYSPRTTTRTNVPAIGTVALCAWPCAHLRLQLHGNWCVNSDITHGNRSNRTAPPGETTAHLRFLFFTSPSVFSLPFFPSSLFFCGLFIANAWYPWLLFDRLPLCTCTVA